MKDVQFMSAVIMCDYIYTIDTARDAKICTAKHVDVTIILLALKPLSAVKNWTMRYRIPHNANKILSQMLCQ